MEQKSIDINQILTQGLYKEHTGRQLEEETIPTNKKTIKIPDTNPFSEYINSDKKSLIITNAETQKERLCFVLNSEQNTLQLIQRKNNKTRLFELDFNKHFLSVNKRKADDDDFQKFSEQTKKISNFLAKNDFYVLQEVSNDTEDKNKDSKKNIAELIKKEFGFFKNKNLANYKNLDLKTKKELAFKLFKLASNLFSVTEEKIKSDEKSKYQEQINYIKEIYLDMLGPDIEQLIVTNLNKTESKPIYTLYISKQKLIFTEKGISRQPKIELNFEKEKYLINGKPLSNVDMDWFIERTQVINQNIINNNVEILKN
jgi:hypothetical protein